MTIGLLMIAAGAAVYFGIRCLTTKRGIRQAKQELVEIAEQPEENRILKLASPNRDLEALLVVMNHILEKNREDRISYKKREQEFRRQIENISHDLRTPLTAIQGYLSLMDQEHLSGESREALEVIHRRADNLQYLINQFYEYSILISDDQRLEMQQIELGRMCREMLLGSYQKLEERGIEVCAEIPEKSVFIQADEHALERILGNLLQNAVRYAKTGLKLKVFETEEAAEILCANDTEHLKSEDVPKLFDRFYMAEQARNQAGTGLGLTISRHLTEAMGGTMTAELEEKWLMFHVVFFKKNENPQIQYGKP